MKPLTLTLNSRSLFLATIGVALAAGGWLAGQGPLTPSGAPAPTMKTLAQIEPRTPISDLPYTISAPGSYYLTANLTGGASGGITISASGVSLDLMGFELAGGTGDGISVIGNRTNLVVRNGTVSRWSGAGVDASKAIDSQVERLAVASNGLRGIFTGTGSTVTGCVVLTNGSHGISVADSSTVSGCTARENTGNGISANFGSTITGCTLQANSANGILADSACTVSDCTAANHFIGDGIRTGPSCTVSGCTALNSANFGIFVGTGCAVSNCATQSNPGSGLSAGASSSVNGCTSVNNGGKGIMVGDRSSVIGCAASSNADGIVAGSGCTIKDSEASNNSGVGIQVGNGFGGTTIRGCTARANTGDGITVFNSCLVVDNLCDGNGAGVGNGAGIHVTGSVNRIEGNHVTSNDRGMDVDSTPNFIVRNTASGNATNYDISAGNRVGVTVIPPPGTAFTGHTGGEGVATADPWANFTY